MERLTMTDAEMEEIRQYNPDFDCPVKADALNFCDYVCDEFQNNCPFKNMGNRLKAYEDAEEQGLLLRLPCKVGDTAWVIDEDFEYPKKKKIYEAKWVRVTFVQVSANRQFELRGEVSYQVYDCFCDDGRTMPNGMYVGQTHTKVGEVVFLTKEEAEQALKQMGE